MEQVTRGQMIEFLERGLAESSDEAVENSPARLVRDGEAALVELIGTRESDRALFAKARAGVKGNKYTVEAIDALIQIALRNPNEWITRVMVFLADVLVADKEAYQNVKEILLGASADYFLLLRGIQTRARVRLGKIKGMEPPEKPAQKAGGQPNPQKGTRV